MIPGPWVALILALAIFRGTRLIAWDTFAPIAALRRWVTGEHVVNEGSTNARLGTTSEAVKISVRYRRPAVAELFHCPYCLGLWLSGLVYALWLLWPTATLYAAVPMAASAVVGAWARWVDP